MLPELRVLPQKAPGPGKTGPAEDGAAETRSIGLAVVGYSVLGLVVGQFFRSAVAAVIVGGLMGYFLDRWLHTKMVFTLLLGGIGFFAGIRDILRRFPGSKDGSGRG